MATLTARVEEDGMAGLEALVVSVVAEVVVGVVVVIRWYNGGMLFDILGVL